MSYTVSLETLDKNLLTALDKDSLSVINQIKEKIVGTDYEGKLYLVGGMVRDILLGSPSQDIDIVTELEIEPLLNIVLKDLSYKSATPIVYGRFGTGMIEIMPESYSSPVKVEFIQARSEVYHPSSRKPKVKAGTLKDDALRRDFTINTLMISLSDGKLIDPLGVGVQDLTAGRICSYTPDIAFRDDPLRMLRAVRFAVRFGFTLSSDTSWCIKNNAPRLRVISAERIRDELVKMFLCNAKLSLYYLDSLDLLKHTPLEPLTQLVGLDQSNGFHIYDAWEHTRVALEELNKRFVSIIKTNSSQYTELIWAMLLHDVGKPFVIDRSGDEYHFYDHEEVGATMAFDICSRLKFPNDFCKKVSTLVGMHMRVPEKVWSVPAFRRLAKDLDEAGISYQDLFAIMECDSRASNPEYDTFRQIDMCAKMEQVLANTPVEKLESPLTGQEIMEYFSLEPGPLVGKIKTALSDAVINGWLTPESSKEKIINHIKSTFKERLQ